MKTLERYLIATFARLLMAIFIFLFFIIKAHETAVAFLALSLTIKKLNK